MTRWIALFGILGCDAALTESTEELCTDGIDNDANGALDCMDASCLVEGFCDPSPTPDYCTNCWGETTGWVQVEVGNDTACALRNTGEVACWGEGGDGQLDVPSGTYTAISSAGSHTCGILTDGRATCWGESTYGKDSPPDLRFTEISVGKSHSLSLIHI